MANAVPSLLPFSLCRACAELGRLALWCVLPQPSRSAADRATCMTTRAADGEWMSLSSAMACLQR